MSRSSPRPRPGHSYQGDSAPPAEVAHRAADTAQTLYLVADEAAQNALSSWHRAAIVVPPTLARVETDAFYGAALVILHDPTREQQQWAERLATHLVQGKQIVKVLLLSATLTVTEWLQTEGSPEHLDRHENLAPRFEPLKESQIKAADWMVSYVLDNAKLLASPLGEAFLRYTTAQTQRTAKLGSRDTSDFLLSAYYDAFGKTPPEEAIRSARSALGMHARLHGERVEAFLRVGHHGGRLYLDLGDASWSAVMIDPVTGWKVVDNPDAVFLRSADMAALPPPATRVGTSDVLARAGFEALCHYVHVGSDEEAYLLWGYLVFCLNPHGPYPHLAFVGGQNTGKTVVTELVRSVVDPMHRSKTRSLPTNARDLAIATRGTYLLAFDNVSHLSDKMSDVLCRLSTGFGHAERRLTTDDEEELFFATRPFLTNGIVDVVEREDLASRTFTMHLQRPRNPVDPETLARQFAQDHPVILAGLLECAWMAHLTGGMAIGKPATRLLMFERWAATAAFLVGGDLGTATIVNALEENQRNALAEAAGLDLLVGLLRALVSASERWSGTMTELREALLSRLPDPGRPPSAFPSGPRALSAAMTRKASLFESVGLLVVDEGYEGPRYGRRHVYSLSLTSSPE